MTTPTPTPAQCAILATCLAPDAEVEARLRVWEALVELDDLDGPSFAIAPFLYLRLRRAGVQARDAGRLKGIYARAWYLERTGVDVPTIPAGVVVMRGAAVRLVAYDGQPGRSAIDTVVLGGDYRFADAGADPRVLDRAIASARDLVDAGDPGGSVVRTCAPAYHLLDALLRGTGWHADPDLVPLLDAGLLAARAGADDWDLLVEETARCGWRPLVEPRLRLLAAVGGQVPADALDRIGRLRAGAGAGLVALGARRSGWSRRVLLGAYGLYLSDPGHARGPRIVVDYPVRNARLAARALHERRVRG